MLALFPKTRRYRIALGLAGIVLLGAGVLFHPAVQKKLLLRQLGPLLDTLQIGRVQLTPWSLELERLQLGYRGARISLPQGTLRFFLPALLWHEIDIEALQLDGLSLDLRDYQAATAPETPEPSTAFPGVLALPAFGFGYTLMQLQADAEVQLPGQQSLNITLTGKGIRPRATGSLGLTLRLATGEADDHIDLDGRIYLAQRDAGRLQALESYLDMAAALSALPQTEHAGVAFNVHETDTTTAAPDTQTQDETWQLAWQQTDGSGDNRARLALQGNYAVGDARFDGNYTLNANERLVQPYAGKTRVPPYEENLHGQLQFSTADTSAELTVVSDLLVKQLRETGGSTQLPEYLQLKSNFRIALLPDLQLRVETLDSGLSDELQNVPLTTRLPADLHVPLKDIHGFLHQENTLLEFELPRVPLSWLNAVLPGQIITAGTLSGGFAVTTDKASALHIKPLEPLRLGGLELTAADGTRYAQLNVTARPGISYRDGVLDLALRQLTVESGGNRLATASGTARLAAGGDPATALDTGLEVGVETRQLAAWLAGKPVRNRRLPQHMDLKLHTSLHRQANDIVLDRLDAGITRDKGSKMLNLALQQPVVLAHGPQGLQVRNDSGTLATLDVSDIRLGWFSGLVPDTTLQGVLHRARLELSAGAAGSMQLSSNTPLALRDVTITGRHGPLLQKFGIRVRPVLDLTAQGNTLRFRDLALTGATLPLLSGQGELTLPAADDQALRAEGHLEADLQGLSQQPLLSGLLQAPVSATLRLATDYRLAVDADHVDISKLSAQLLYDDGQPRLTLTAEDGVRIRTRLGRNRSELGRARGKLTLDIANLGSAPFADILAARGVVFGSASGKAVLESDGRSMSINTLEPLQVTGLSVKSGDTALLQAFTLQAMSSARLDGNRLQAQLDPVSVVFEQRHDSHALDGRLALTLRGDGDRTLVDVLDAEFKLQLPAWLDQPALLPRHTLRTGTLDSVVRLDNAGRLAASARVHDLGARQALPLQSLLLEVSGQLAADGGFTLEAPLTTQGHSGTSSLRINARQTVHSDADNTLDIALGSPVFYLNDIINTLNAVAGRTQSGNAGNTSPSAAAQPTGTTPEVADSAADTRAFWDIGGYNTRLSVDLDHLYYTDYLDIEDIHAHAAINRQQLALQDCAAHFHDSPLRAAGTLAFTGGDTPYELALQTGVRQFDLARFLRELAPGAEPRAEGLFDVSLDASGRSPNMAQYRNNLLFDAHLHSSKGLFRVFDPDSALLAGSTGVATGFGELVSYLPTGLFGVGAVSRLVDYIKVIDYDKIDIHLTRDTSRNVQIREYVVQSPEVLLTASGGIEYSAGKDILHSPLAMDAQLSMRDKGAAILYSLDLLQPEKDAWGYWKGPAIHFRGTPANPVSNLDEILADAGQGAILGSITRPIAGLIGNIRHRWIGEDKPALEYSTEEQEDTPH